MKHTGIRKFKLTPACLLLLLLSVNLCVEESMCLSKMTKWVASSIGTVQSKCCQYTVFLPFQTLRQLQPGRVAACHHLHQCSDPVRWSYPAASAFRHCTLLQTRKDSLAGTGLFKLYQKFDTNFALVCIRTGQQMTSSMPSWNVLQSELGAWTTGVVTKWSLNDYQVVTIWGPDSTASGPYHTICWPYQTIRGT